MEMLAGLGKRLARGIGIGQINTTDHSGDSDHILGRGTVQQNNAGTTFGEHGPDRTAQHAQAPGHNDMAVGQRKFTNMGM